MHRRPLRDDGLDSDAGAGDDRIVQRSSFHHERDTRICIVLGVCAALALGCGDGGSTQHRVTPSPTSLPASATPTASPSPTPDDTLPSALDNGTQGRNPFNNPAHVAPPAACADELRASDSSLIIRMLPRGPLAPGGTLAFTSGVCVYLPPGYLDSGLEYPVLYLLHGGGGDQADWVTYGGIRSIMDDAIAADASNAAIVVLPDGDDAQWYDSLDGSIQNQRYVLDSLIPFVDRHLRTIASRAGRAVDGLSNGGYGAMHLAAKAPDRFVAAGGMSSNLAGLSFAGLGDPTTSPAYRHGSLPVDLVGNLDGVDLALDIGTICITDKQRDNCLAWQFEQLFVPANRDFVDHLRAARTADDGVLDYRETEGAHSWNWWPLWLRERHLPFLLARLADPRPADNGADPPPLREGFRYRSIAAAFSVWGYDVHVDRAVREFLDLRDVRADGLEAQGSGQVTIRTAPRYVPGTPYTVSGAGGPDQPVEADDAGRITFTVDLGPSHEFEQYSPQATALEAAGDYWTARDVVISER
jgi:S-formylglutathione hydrolase FrmB